MIHFKRYSIPGKWKTAFVLLLGAFSGLAAYTIYMSRAWTYLSDEASTCVNCHVMTPQYASWFHSSHRERANCNDCHVPHDNLLNKYAFKAKDGLYHSYVFTMRNEPQAIRAKEASSSVIMQNCIRCHTDLNTALASAGMIDFLDTRKGKGKACWDCHRNVAHGKVSHLSSAPNALAPLPKSPIPKWLKNKMNSNTPKNK